jgi:hypothetical protein
VTNFVTVPPPEYSISTTSSNPLILRPGEERSIELIIKSATEMNSFAFLSTNKIDDIDVTFTPNRVSVLPSGEAVSIVTIKALDSAKPREYTIPIIANVSFSSSVEATIKGHKHNFSNPLSANITNDSNLTLTVKEPLNLSEQLTNFSNAWITPISGMWSFLAGVAAVVAPLLVRIYRKRHHKSEDEKTNKSNS